MSIETRPALHPNATAEELVSYGHSYAETFFEKELLEMFEQLLDESGDLDEREAELDDREALLDDREDALDLREKELED